MEFTSLFLENLFLEVGNNLGSVLPGITVTTGGVTISTGSNLSMNGAEEVDDDFCTGSTSLMLGTLASEIGSNLCNSGLDAYDRTLEQLNTTQAYMESLNQEELETLITKLLEKNIELYIEDNQHKTKKL